ncbi:hypothetical protein EVJ58_g3345 [Rhodofomes roseus]|uniref:DNA (cytosine-5-)-methyltransferase n=1 Tax=Rhodofomes roseus TaxID=34475 RepID=A0A4Y9YMC9_9APHY|nr:hypothetical protein EVJ58_g3345 [Rhodofomes roseus]
MSYSSTLKRGRCVKAGAYGPLRLQSRDRRVLPANEARHGQGSVGAQDDDGDCSVRSGSGSSASKRKQRDDAALDLLPIAVKRKLAVRPKDRLKDTPDLQYTPDPADIKETGDTVILGEDPDDLGGDGLPVRVLSEFAVFDPKEGYHLYSLSDENIGQHKLHAAGFVSAVYVNDEDEGQEDDVEGSVQCLRTAQIEQYSLDYETRDDPLYIQSKHAWYQLRNPSDMYLVHHRAFYRPHRVTQILLSSAKENLGLQWDELIELATTMRDPLLGVRIHPDDFLAAVPLISVILSEIQHGGRLKRVPAVRQLLEGKVPISRLSMPEAIPAASTGRQHRQLGNHPRIFHQVNNIDLAVLRPENQNPTRVTPLIEQLARGWFNERLFVVGAKLPEEHREIEANRAHLWMRQRLGEYIERQMSKKESKKKRFDSYANGDRIVDEFWGAVLVDGVKYSVGDTILTPRGSYEQRNERAAEMPEDLKDIPADAIISDYFWFGRIIHINQRRRKMHLQWFDHAPRGILEELADPRELFLWNSCGEIDADEAYGNVEVLYSKPPGAQLRDGRAESSSVFYCNYLCNETLATFTSVSEQDLSLPQNCMPPDNCPPCMLSTQREQEQTVTPIGNGIAYRSHRFHRHDFVLIDVRVLAYIAVQQHLFMTEEEAEVPVEDLLSPCFVVPAHALTDDGEKREWLSSSPKHFYVKYRFPTMLPTRWADRTRLAHDDLLVCAECFEDDKQCSEDLQKFARTQKRRPLRGFDPFGGVGAFGLAMEESGCVKMCQSVEISPSAAHASRSNSPQMVVHNQCSNVVLEYAIKVSKHHKLEVPKEIGNSQQPLPVPPKPEDIDIIVAGFPCQPHSRLNMFQHANDRKSLLILNLLSWVDFLKPRYCVFENVRGFLKYNLHAFQAGKHQVEGGVDMGGLKFLVKALLAMRYQVCFGLLQAAHYGTPQARPTHDFPLADALQMKFSNESQAQPINTQRGSALHHFVSVDDAIGKVPRELIQLGMGLSSPVNNPNTTVDFLAMK